jgi:hypothetical protein
LVRVAWSLYAFQWIIALSQVKDNILLNHTFIQGICRFHIDPFSNFVGGLCLSVAFILEGTGTMRINVSIGNASSSIFETFQLLDSSQNSWATVELQMNIGHTETYVSFL